MVRFKNRQCNCVKVFDGRLEGKVADDDTDSREGIGGGFIGGGRGVGTGKDVLSTIE